MRQLLSLKVFGKVIASVALIAFLSLASFVALKTTSFEGRDGRFIRLATAMVNEGSADAALMWRVNTTENYRVLKAFVLRGAGEVTSFNDIKLDYVSTVPVEREQQLKIENREMICAPLVVTSDIGRTLEANKITTICRIGLFVGNEFNGYMTLGFKDEPVTISTVRKQIMELSR